MPADLVVDASGRAGRLGAEHRPRSEGAPAGVAYATRQYQLLPGATPGPTNGGPGLIKEHDGFMQLVFTHDRGTFSLLLVRADDDTDLAELRHEHVFEAAVAALPESSAWTDPSRAVPIDQGPCGFGSGELLPGPADRVSASWSSATPSARPTPPAREASASA